MFLSYHIPLWKQAPALRLLLPLIAGIILQWYLQFSFTYIAISLTCLLLASALFRFFNVRAQYHLYRWRGLVTHLLILSFGMLLTWQRDARTQGNWYGHYLTDSSRLLLKINEPLQAKARSIKAEALVTAVINGAQTHPTTGKLLLYFSKDSSSNRLRYGDFILAGNQLQPIRNSGNPGAFNYKRYAAFQQLYHQAFLKPNHWVPTKKYAPEPVPSFLYASRSHVLTVLRNHISNHQNQLGIAEALLIGYKEDLDKDLVQAYSNTGVVHIIAISGLHLGLIYMVLLWILNRTPYLKKWKMGKAVLLIVCLWTFALITGGAASVMRSAVMFTTIVIGKNFFKHAHIYQSLASSAIILLLANPYYLWDVGFQLSYAAVLGIVAFQPYLKKRWMPPRHFVSIKIWELLTASLAAQIGTLPLCIYYFHQAPTLFLLSNLIAVPLSTIILFGEILLIIIASWQAAAQLLGQALSWAIAALNRIILFFDGFAFSVWDGIYANALTTWVLYAVFVCGMYGLMLKNPKALKAALLFVALFATLHLYAFFTMWQQKKIIVYNISRMRAIDFVYQNQYRFWGDSALLHPGLQQNFHLKPARISLQAGQHRDALPGHHYRGNYHRFGNKSILLLDSSFAPQALPAADIIIISQNPRLDLRRLSLGSKPQWIVMDASNALWKIQQWKSQCEELLLRSHSIPEQGAFVLDIE